MLEVLLEQVFGLIHHLRAHDHKQLSPLEACLVSAVVVVLHDFDDRSLLDGVVRKLDQDRSEGGRGCLCDATDSVLAELEEHREELLVDDGLVEQCHVFPEVPGQEFLSAPVFSRLVEGLGDVLDVARSLFRLDLSQKHVEVLHDADFDFLVLVLEEFVRNC